MPGLDQTAVRRVNTGVVLRALADADADVTLQELVSATGLSRRTIELILGELAADGWVALAVPTVSGGAGRPAKRFRFESRRLVVAAVVLDSHSAVAVIADLRGGELARAAVALPDESRDPALTVALASDAVRRALAEAGVAPERLAAGTVAAGGVIDARGVVGRLVNAPLWSGFALAAAFEQALGIPFAAENDANLAALAEHWAGASIGRPDSAWLILGHRTGAGFLLGGEIHRGPRGTAGELVESRVLNLHGVPDEAIRSLTSPIEADRRRAREAVVAAAAGDPRAVSDARAFAEQIADVIDVLTWTIAPETVVLGGGLEVGAGVLVPLVSEFLRDRGTPEVELVATRLGGEAPLVGAIRRALVDVDSWLYSAPGAQPPRSSEPSRDEPRELRR
ncbi:ROK family protein [Frondihabitans sp. PhB188]|uniref:ROK family transcriptional regulator n=1 Tax=Frondihabitans sp. PhB188 TaxID=2485200 RepID=UPI001315232A|nr:ROK family protein [Frondihabitans sp. PhB188]